MEDMHADEDNQYFNSQTWLTYKTKLEQLDTTVTNRTHTTRVRDIVLSVLPDLRAHSQGRDILLLFEKDLGSALMKACDHDSDSMHLVRAAEVVRREMLETRFTFDGAFQADSQKDSVTPSLLALVNMILDGANIKHQTHLVNTSTTTAALTLSQLLVSNSVKHARSMESTSVRHSRERETPFPFYFALKIHALTRNRGLIDKLLSQGRCVCHILDYYSTQQTLTLFAHPICAGNCSLLGLSMILTITLALRRPRIIFMALVSP